MENSKQFETEHRAVSRAVLLLRLALSATFFSAVFSRLGLWGAKSSGWESFLDYTAQVNSFAPSVVIPLLAIGATILETVVAALLLLGYKTQAAAYLAAFLTLTFALAMAYSFGIKNPLDYSVFADSAAAFLLAVTASNGTWSLETYLENRGK
ncbi:DoxX family membrane protein [Sinomicrobium sp. M5D2P9]